MLTTEEKYVEDLKHTVEGYMDPLTQNPDPEINVLAESVSSDFSLRWQISYYYFSFTERSISFKKEIDNIWKLEK